MRSRVIHKDEALTAGRWDFPAVDPTAADALRGMWRTPIEERVGLPFSTPNTSIRTADAPFMTSA